ADGRDIAVRKAIEHVESVRTAGGPIRRDDDVRHGIHGNPDDVAEVGLEPADLPLRRDIAIGETVEYENRARAGIGRDNLAVDGIDFDRLRADQARVRSLDDPDGHLVAARIALEDKDRPRERDRHDY